MRLVGVSFVCLVVVVMVVVVVQHIFPNSTALKLTELVANGHFENLQLL